MLFCMDEQVCKYLRLSNLLTVKKQEGAEHNILKPGSRLTEPWHSGPLLFYEDIYFVKES